jgi:hypothetical protein
MGRFKSTMAFAIRTLLDLLVGRFGVLANISRGTRFVFAALFYLFQYCMSLFTAKVRLTVLLFHDASSASAIFAMS